MEEAEIRIPVGLPTILKDYAKAVLRCQPDDLIGWSAQYFSEIVSQGSRPGCALESDLKFIIDDEIKQTLKDDDGKFIDFQDCKNIYAEFYGISRIPVDSLRTSWSSRGYCIGQLRELLTLGRMYESSIDRDCFCAIMCARIGLTLKNTLQLFLEAASGMSEPDLQRIPYPKFEKILTFLMTINKDSDEEPNQLKDHLQKMSTSQCGLVTMENLKKSNIPNWKLLLDWTGNYSWT